MKCNQLDCLDQPLYRFTWPGKDEACICGYHSEKLHATATAMGLHVQLIPIVEVCQECLRRPVESGKSRCFNCQDTRDQIDGDEAYERMDAESKGAIDESEAT